MAQFANDNDAEQGAEGLKEKDWKDINFDLWKSDLGRLQYYCTCNAGSQLANPCAHVSTCIYLITWIMNDELDDKLKPTKLAERIKKNIINLEPAVRYFNEKSAQYKKANIALYCVCRQPWAGYMMHCKSCDEWFHAKCLNQTKQQLKQIGRDKFRCNWCDPYVTFINNLSKEKYNNINQLIISISSKKYNSNLINYLN